MRALLSFLLLAVVALAADPVPWPRPDVIQTWRVGSGLPDQRIQAVCQTEDGYLWVGTARGLVRFDGMKFTPVELPAGPSVKRLAAGRDNRLWVGIADGTLLCGRDGRFEPVLPAGQRLDGFEILAEDGAGRLWITSSRHRASLWADGRLRDMTAEWEKNPGRHVAQVRVNALGQPVASASDGVWTIAGESLVPVPGFSGFPGYHAPGRDGGLWVSNDAGVQRLLDGRLSPPVGPARWEGRNLSFGIEDHAGQLWLATLGNGIICYRSDGPFRRLDVRDGLCGDYASCLYVDRQGNVWVGSDGGGLSRITPALFAAAGRTEGLSSDRVTALHAEPDGSVWIGTAGDGLNRFDGRTFAPVAGFPTTGRVMALEGDVAALWIGTSGGLHKWQASRLSAIAGWSQARDEVFALHHDRRGRLWVGQRTTGTVAVTQGGPVKEIRLHDRGTVADVRAFAEDADGRIWIGTDGPGLFAWQDEKVEEVGGFSRIRALAVGDDGHTLWVAADDGLARVRPTDSGAWECDRGWASGSFQTLHAGTAGGLWVTDANGLCFLHVGESAKPARATRFDKADGLPGLQAAVGGYPQSVRSPDGRLWFATTAGVVMVDRSHTIVESPAPRVLLEELRVNGVVRPAGENGAPPEFGSGDRGYEFRFTALDLRHPDMLAFFGRIDGVDEDWRDLGDAHVVFHSTLPPGEHVFRVKVRDHSGRWSDEEALAFHILPPLWQRGWFIALASAVIVIVAASLAWAAARWRVRRQLAELKLEQALAAERARIARDLHDQLGSGLTDIAFLGDALRMDSGSTEAAEVSARARELTRAMDETVWALNPEKDTFQSLISYLGHAVPGWLRPAGIHCRLDLPDESVRFGLSARVRQQLYLACKEAVHNAVKHSGASVVTLRVEQVGQELVITLGDDGGGFDPVEVCAGHGLANLRQRMEDLGGTAHIDSAPGRGTTVVFRLSLLPAP